MLPRPTQDFQPVSGIAKPDNATEPDRAAGTEAATLHRGGTPYIAVLCGSDVFHNAADRWPDALDLATLARSPTFAQSVP